MFGLNGSLSLLIKVYYTHVSGIDRLKRMERWREPLLDLLDSSSGEKTLLCISCQIVIFYIMYWQAHRYTHTYKGLFHPKIKLVLSFIHPHLISHLYKFHFSAEHKIFYIHSINKNTF